MIAQLTGTLLFKSPQYLIIDVNGVGYRVLVSLTSFAALPEVGSTLTIHTHTYFRDDGLSLFGFTTIEEKNLFQKLIAVSGVGPKIALTILSGIPAKELAQAISEQNVLRLKAIPGVGKKTAERIIIELKDKIIKDFSSLEYQSANVSPIQFYDDVLSALINLGYQRQQAEKAMQKIAWHEIQTIENAIRCTLKELAKT